MNNRVLELLKDPKSIQSEDIHLLKEEINSFPYIQNIRALRLYGVHLYDKENYQKELSVTAAYTTDKKILYQLINGKIRQIQKPEPEIIEEVNEEIAPVQETESVSNEVEEKTETEAKIVSEKNQYEEAASLLQTPHSEIKHVYINGERNRILFEGEENFLNEENSEKIDLESTLESGVIVTQKFEKSEKIAEQKIEEKIISDKAEETATFIPETIIEEEKISSEQKKEEIEDNSELSFHETQSFLPEVNIQSNTDKEEVKNDQEEIQKIESIAEFTPEKIIEEENISSETEEKSVRDDSELSFHGLESFLPEVKIQVNNFNEATQSEVPKPNVNKHEEEMRRLIEEVEKKMKAKKETPSENKETEPEVISHEISFAETQAFHIKSDEEKTGEKPQIIQEKLEKTVEISKESEKENITVQEETIAAIQSEVKSTWKPMILESSIPDSLLNKPSEIPQIKTEIQETPKQESVVPVAEKIQESVKNEETEKVTEVLKEEVPKTETQEDKENVPVMNVSFFGSDISSLSISDKNQEEETEETPKDKLSEPLDSNIPGFINTWQNWLKIDRTEEVEASKEEIKNKAIESFIENNPKISQLKDEVNFVVKEKTDDISHLMTETLAKLYLEQKLYTKATNAYQILANKHPEKKDYFEGKIQEIKDIRGKN